MALQPVCDLANVVFHAIASPVSLRPGIIDLVVLHCDVFMDFQVERSAPVDPRRKERRRIARIPRWGLKRPRRTRSPRPGGVCRCWRTPRGSRTSARPATVEDSGMSARLRSTLRRWVTAIHCLGTRTWKTDRSLCQWCPVHRGIRWYPRDRKGTAIKAWKARSSLEPQW